MFRNSLLLILLLLVALPSFATNGAAIQFLISGVNELQGTVSGGSVYSYAAGTTTPKAIYSDRAQTTALDNPATLDVDGRLVAYGSGIYKFVIKDEVGNTVFTADQVEINSVQTLIDNDENPFGDTLTQTNLIVTNLTGDDATFNDLEVASSAVINYLDVNDTIITSVANASDPTDAVNLRQLASYTLTTGSNASTTFAVPGKVTASGTELMKIDGSNASTTVTFTDLRVATATLNAGATNLGQVNALITDLSYLPATSTVPASAAASGTAGLLSYDANYLYLCVSTDTWIRIASSTW